jgi:hypothetical protein
LKKRRARRHGGAVDCVSDSAPGGIKGPLETQCLRGIFVDADAARDVFLSDAPYF